MKMRKYAAMLLAVFALTTGCRQQTDGQPDAKNDVEQPDAPISIVDITGRSTTLDRPADKIIALTAANCEILYALGAGDTLVGRGTYCNYPPEVLNVPEVESGGSTNIEQIIALEPQVVIMSQMAQTTEQAGALENAGISVVISNALSIADVYEDIKVIGAVVGKNSEAADLIAEMKASFDGITAKTEGKSAQTIYFEVSPLEYGLWTAGSGTFMDEIAVMLKLENTFSDVSGWGEVSEEQVISRDPDFIVSSAMYNFEGPDPVTEIKGRQSWQDMKAIQNERVLHTDADEITRPGPRLVDAALKLYDFVYAP
ncbi:MAG: ABC transporter substrate-binding protein [Clostridiales bacterium]|jgi:iron complex transport system substrate-binding protein|nr:ABC transporter substrate-binding protein [Clostridiales bacterium]